jgi:putative phosphoesterase
MSELRIVCLSDTHLRRGSALPSWCLCYLENADLILHAGDLTAPSVLATLERLGRVEAVRGNMDALPVKEVLPKRRIAEIGGARIGLIHDPGPALGRTRRLAQAFPDCDAVVYGHTHVPEIRRLGDRLILNPGSPTARRSIMGATIVELRLTPAGRLEPTLVTPVTWGTGHSL